VADKPSEQADCQRWIRACLLSTPSFSFSERPLEWHLIGDRGSISYIVHGNWSNSDEIYSDNSLDTNQH
jgi:hypothetical protein